MHNTIAVALHVLSIAERPRPLVFVGVGGHVGKDDTMPVIAETITMAGVAKRTSMGKTGP